MSTLITSSQITFLYFKEFEKAKKFFEEALELEEVYNPGWAIVYKITDSAFLGAVDMAEGSIAVEEKGGVLISLTVKNIEDVRTSLIERGIPVSDIKKVKEIELMSFFFKGPEGYDFEVQQFSDQNLAKIF